LLSRIVSWRKNSRFQGEAETMGMAMVTFFGGLDTVANMLSFTTHHLAQRPALRRRLIDEPDLIPQAAEEFIRRFGLSNTGRLVLADHEYKGVVFKKNEMVMVPIALSSMDDRLYENPMEIDFDRNVGQHGHNTFGNGPHRCVGSPLARAELYVFLEEWLKHIPDFRLDPDHSPVTHSGSVNGMNSLYLRWD
jgi:cytochrome P450